jgi:hypothetical protein
MTKELRLRMVAISQQQYFLFILNFVSGNIKIDFNICQFIMFPHMATTAGHIAVST